MKTTSLSIFVLLIITCFASGVFAQGVTINDDGSEGNSNSILDINATTNDKGILIPRISSADRAAITLGAGDEGLTVYDTDTKTYWLWDGTLWADFNKSPKHYIGEIFDGGIIFYVDETGQHGFMASLDNLDGGSGVAWSNITTILIGDSAQYMTYGASNTNWITGQTGHTSSAAKLCTDHNGGGHSDWYLPSIKELIMMFSVDVTIDNILNKDGDNSTNGLNYHDMYTSYWSSTEYNGNATYYYLPSMFSANAQSKTSAYYVRAIRSF